MIVFLAAQKEKVEEEVALRDEIPSASIILFYF